MTNETNKQKILGGLTKEFQSTGKIASLTQVNYYIAFKCLTDLLEEGKLEMVSFGVRIKKWRIKQ